MSPQLRMQVNTNRSMLASWLERACKLLYYEEEEKSIFYFNFRAYISLISIFIFRSKTYLANWFYEQSLRYYIFKTLYL